MTKSSSRRAMLMVIGGTVLCACGPFVPDEMSDAARSDAQGGECLSIFVGNLALFPVGSWKIVLVNRVPYVIAHDEQGLYAYSGSCTHQATTISVNASTGVGRCPAHGAVYDGNGNVTLGPARISLPHFPVTVCNEDVFIDDSVTVASSTRTPVG